MKTGIKKTVNLFLLLPAVFIGVFGVFGVLAAFPTAALAGVSFTDGQFVKLGYATPAPPMWEAKTFPLNTGVTVFLGSPLPTGESYGDTNVWEDSRVRRHLNETFLPAHFSPEELAAGVLSPYGNAPFYDVVVPDTGSAVSAVSAGSQKVRKALAIVDPGPGNGIQIPPSSAGDALVWILDVQEIQAIYNGQADLPWDDAGGYAQRLPCAAGGPYRTRSADDGSLTRIWTLNSNGSFSAEPVSSPAVVRPVVLPDTSVMLYKRGTGTQANPYAICYRWDALPEISAPAKGSVITLTFPEPELISNNGAWPGAEAWRITDSRGTSYTLTGTLGAENRLTLTVYPALAENVTLTLRYAQSFDDAAQGLNNTKGAILRTASLPLLHFGIPDMTLEFSTGSADEDGGCGCEANAGACLCGSALSSGCGCAHDDDELKILNDNVHYLVLGKPFILDPEAEGGAAPYAWSVKDGVLPKGLTLSAEGIAEGTPTVPGSFRVTFQVSDSSGKTASKRFTFLVVEDEKLAVMTDTLPDAQAGVFYTARVRAGGGTKPYAWTVENLPAWLFFDSDSGILSGTPDDVAIHDLTVRVRDGEGNSDSKLLRLSAYPHDGLILSVRDLPAPIYGKDYSAQLKASGGIPPYFFALRRGDSLPSGLTLNTEGTLSGTANQKGIHSFVTDVMDGNGLQGSAAFTMVVVDEEALAPDVEAFTVRENEKQIFLSFSLPGDFSDAEILAVEPVMTPDGYISGFSSAVKKEENGIYNVELTMKATGQAPLEAPVLEGIVVRFHDASGEVLAFVNPLPVKDMKKEEGKGGESGGGGGCNAGWGALLFFLAPIAVLAVLKTGSPLR